MKIRVENKEDYEVVERLIELAFISAENSNKDEHNLIARIRLGNNYVPELSLVAEKDSKILGQILLSKVDIRNKETVFQELVLAPISVLPEYQKQGIGSSLIKEAISKAKKMGYSLIIVLGYPSYYSKFGFKKAKDFGIETSIPEFNDYLMLLKLENSQDNISGKVIYGPEFLLEGK